MDAILPTIRSRCQPVLFAPLAEDDVAELLLTLAWAPDERTARETARLSAGSMFTARQLLLPEFRELRELVFSKLAEPAIDPFSLAESVQEKLEALSADAATQRVHAGWAIRFCVEFVRGQLRELASSPGDPSDFAADAGLIDRLAAQLERCFDAEGHLHQSMPVALCLEGLFDALSLIRRDAVPA
jgi:DNA polymerase-3 subunit delta'